MRVVVCVRAWAARKEISLCFAQRIKEDEENSIPEECRGRGRGKNSTSAPNAVKIKETERPYTFISSLLTIGVISKSTTSTAERDISYFLHLLLLSGPIRHPPPFQSLAFVSRRLQSSVLIDQDDLVVVAVVVEMF